MSSYNEKDPIDESCHGECHYSCLTCTNTADRDCLTCERNNYRYIYEGYCVCFDGFYDDGSSDTCQ